MLISGLSKDQEENVRIMQSLLELRNEIWQAHVKNISFSQGDGASTNRICHLPHSSEIHSRWIILQTDLKKALISKLHIKTYKARADFGVTSKQVQMGLFSWRPFLNSLAPWPSNLSFLRLSSLFCVIGAIIWPLQGYCENLKDDKYKAFNKTSSDSLPRLCWHI